MFGINGIVRKRTWLCMILVLLYVSMAAVPVSAYGSLKTPSYRSEIPGKIESQIVVVYKNEGYNNVNSVAKASAVKLEAAKRVSERVDVVTVKKGQNPEKVLQELRAMPSVVSAGYNQVLKTSAMPNDTYLKSTSSSNYAWWYSKIKADKTWNFTPKGSVVVAVVDSGVNTSHPDLKGRITTGYDYIGKTTTMKDVYGHGTAVAGIIAALANNGKGIAGVAGKANIKIAPYRVGGRHASDNTLELSLAAAALLKISKRPEVKVVNMSFGNYYSRYGVVEEDKNLPFYRAIKECVSKGKVMVAAAGNEGNDYDYNGWYSYPASYNNVISVAATDKNDKDTYFSQYNDRVDIAAPGADIMTTNKNGGYSKVNGTSFSAPMVSAAAALMLAQNPSLKASSVESLLKSTAKDIRYQGYDSVTGAGLLQLDYLVPVVIKTQPTSVKAALGKRATLSVTATSAGGAMRYQWYKDGAAIKGAVSATYSVSKVSGAHVGNYYCRVSRGSYVVMSNTVRIDAPTVAVKSIAIAGGSRKLAAGSATALKAVVTPSTATSKTVSWRSSNPKVATVDSKGVVRALQAGTCVILATSSSTPNVLDLIEIKVFTPVNSLKLSKTSAVVKTRSSYALKPVVTPTNATYRTLKYQSSNSLVAKVSSSGVITGVKKGTATITIMTTDGSQVKKSFKVTVV